MGTLTQSSTAIRSFHFTYLGQLADEETTHVFRVVPEYGEVLCPECKHPGTRHDTDEVIVRADGSVSIGASIPPALLRWFQS